MALPIGELVDAASGLLFAESVADAAIPYAADPDEMGDDERLEIYRRQAEVAWSDGALSPDERAMLDDLKDELGIEDSQAAAVESAVAEGVGGEG